MNGFLFQGAVFYSETGMMSIPIAAF